MKTVVPHSCGEVPVDARVEVQITLNGCAVQRPVEARMLLVDFIRHEAKCTGTHVGCEHGVCGACTVSVDGIASRSCLMFAVQADGAHVRTIEDQTSPILQVLRQEFHKHHALQCGFCTPGLLLTLEEFLSDFQIKTETEVVEALNGNLCRCTGYLNLIAAVRSASVRLSALPPTQLEER